MRGPHTAMKSGPRLLQLEKALAQKQRPNTAKNKERNKKKKNIDVSEFTYIIYIYKIYIIYIYKIYIIYIYIKYIYILVSFEAVYQK